MSTLVSLLPALACPLGMGLMMWLMTRGSEDRAATATADEASPDAGADDGLASLRAQLGEVEAQQAALAAQIGRFGAADGPGSTGKAAPTVAAEAASARLRA